MGEVEQKVDYQEEEIEVKESLEILEKDINKRKSTNRDVPSTPTTVSSNVRLSSPMVEDIQYSVKVFRGSCLPKKWNEKKVHPTYEVTTIYCLISVFLTLILTSIDNNYNRKSSETT